MNLFRHDSGKVTPDLQRFNIKPGDYVVVKVLYAASTTLRTEAVGLTTLSDYSRQLKL